MSEFSQVEAAEVAPEVEVTAAPIDVDNEAPGEQEPPRTFTQEELDAKVGERLAKERRKWERDQRQAQQPTQQQSTVEAPKPDQFKTVEEYFDALSTHKAEQIVAQRESQKQLSQIETAWEDRVEAAHEKYEDFHQVALKHPRDGGPVITDEMAHVIKMSEIGPEIAYHLGTNVKESNRIARLDPLSQAREIGKIEASLSTNPPAKKTSSAPDPIKPVGTRSSSPARDTSDPRSVKELSDSEWINRRNRELAKKAQG